MRRGGTEAPYARAWLVAVIVWGAGAHAAAQSQEPTPDPAYQQVVGDAVAEYDRGNWAEARALFLKAHEITPSARTWRTLGMTAFELRDYVQAMRELGSALSDERRPLEADRRAEVEALLARTHAYVGRIRVVLDPPDATLFVDDRPGTPEQDGALLLPLGEHVLRAEAEGRSPRTRRLTIQGREDESIELRLETLLAAAPTSPAPPAATSVQSTSTPTDTGSGGLTWTWVAAAGAVAFGGAAVGLGLAADAEYDDLKNECENMSGGACVEGDPSREADDSKLTTLETLTNVSIGLAAASAVTAVVLYVVESDGGSEAPAARVEMGAGHVALRGRF